MHQATTNESMIGVPSRLCSVCGDISTGIHFGGNSCESCKAFFRRSVQCLRFQNYKCSSEERCPVNIVTRKVCQFCRYAKCTAIGMKPKWVLSDQEREEKYGARRKRFRENRAAEEDPDIYKYLTKEEKLLVEDIAHALYQSRATYPLNFPSPSVLFGAAMSPDPTGAPSPNNEKPPSASANLLIVPIQRLVLFARMLKDFDLFTEDDKVCLLKGSAIEMMVCSSSTLFNPKTHTFTNYLSRDQRAIMDDQVMPLDPLLTRLWGEDIFNRTRTYLISMCNLNVDEVTSTLLAPIILFSPDRPNIKELDLVKRLQIKYVSVLRKYMNWRYGIEHTDRIYPKLLLQIVNVRTLSLAHGEVIQKLMATSSVNPLVQEVTIKQDLLSRATTEKMDSLSISSSPTDLGSMDFDKTPSNETESNGSDDDDPTKKSSRPIYDDDFDFDPDEIDGSDPRTIWRKRRRLAEYPPTTTFTAPAPPPPLPSAPIITTATGATVGSGRISTHFSPTPMHSNINPLATTTTNDVSNIDPYQRTNSLLMRPYDHQVPSNLPILQDDVMMMNASGFPMQNEFESSPLKNDLFAASPQAIQQLQQLYRAQTSTSSDISPFDFDTRSNPVFNSTLSPATRSLFDEATNDLFPQQYSRPSPGTYQQQQNEQQMHLLSLGNNSSPTSAMQSFPDHLTTHASHTAPPTSTTVLNDEEQQLLDAIHAHPNKRDLVLSLLRQMNQSTSPSAYPTSPNNPVTHQHQQHQQQQQHQQRHPNSTGQDHFSGHFNLEHADRSS